MKTVEVKRDAHGRRILVFEGIDDWNRPVFKDSLNYRWGDVNNLFNWNATADEVLAKITVNDICYFGHSFNKGEDPNGATPDPNKIILTKKTTKDER